MFKEVNERRVVLTYLLYRNFINSLLAMVPEVTGIFVVMGFMGWKDIPLNIFHILSAILIVGLAVDVIPAFFGWIQAHRLKAE